MSKQKSLIGITVIAIVIFSGLWLYSRATDGVISICVQKNGAVHVIGDEFRRDDCRKNETLLTWNTQGPKGDKGDAGDKGDQGGQGLQGEVGPQGPAGKQLHLYDGNGQDLGILINKDIGSQDDYFTYNDNLGLFLRFENNNQPIPVAMFDPRAITLYFEQSNCQGKPFIHMQATQSISESRYLNNKQYWIYDMSEPPKTRIALSIGDTDKCQIDVQSIDLTVHLQEISLPFTLPLAWPLEVREN